MAQFQPGRTAAEALGEAWMIAGDVLDNLPFALMETAEGGG